MALVIGRVYFINKVSATGWLTVAVRTTGARIQLLEYTKIKIIDIARRRIYFEVMDGGQKGTVASFPEVNAPAYIGNDAPAQGIASATVNYGAVEQVYSREKGINFNQQTAVLTVEGITAEVTLNTDIGKAARGGGVFPIPPGTYKILVPSQPQDKCRTKLYRIPLESNLRSDRVWFPIEFDDNSRFIHLGSISDGCVSVMEWSKWNTIYESLIRYRSPDGRYVGELTVQK